MAAAPLGATIYLVALERGSVDERRCTMTVHTPHTAVEKDALAATYTPRMVLGRAGRRVRGPAYHQLRCVPRISSVEYK